MGLFVKFLFCVLLSSLTCARRGQGEGTSSNVSAITTQVPVQTSSAASATSNNVETVSPTPSDPVPDPQTSSSGASGAVPSNAIQISPPANLTMCDTVTFTWEYDFNRSMPISLVVTNERATQTSRLRRQSQSALVSRTLTTDVPAIACTFTWPAVNVPEGSYNLVAFDTSRSAGLFSMSQTFFVTPSNDTECMNSNLSTSTASSIAPSSLPSPGRGSPTLTTGALAGITTGVVVGVAGLLAAFIFPRLRRRRAARSPVRPGAPLHLF